MNCEKGLSNLRHRRHFPGRAFGKRPAFRDNIGVVTQRSVSQDRGR